MFDPAARTRARLRALETRTRDRTEAAAVADGVAETVGLSEARGAAFEGPPSVGQPYRRQTGLDWLARKGRISAAQKSAGERYGALYRRASRAGAIRSTLDVRPGGGGPSGPGAREEVLLMAAEGSAQAAARLAAMRSRLWDQADLVSACDLVCGQELTPREAVASEREVGRIEALVSVALDVLAGEGA
ncbi:hypothetical protein [Phenylobacterium sp.]|uniref:hypothetical protein n=1 Tax=Phenylobacterium sp. TaxID=1871053 RepID=UPI002730047D|nr:hypothetical protein [Phenylobacterium sp.]MDP1873730.1 hypothetical protein [Phenylobacterium sp.]